MICGTKFIEISNIRYCPVYNNLYLPYNVDILQDIYRLDKPIVYCHTDWISNLFEIIKNINKNIILISHNSDHFTPNIPIPKCVKKWYSQNVSIINNPIIESIPVGIENSVWFPESDKPNKILNKLKEIKEYKNLLYVNFNIKNNTKERQEPYILFKDKSWVTMKYYKNGERFDEYCDDIFNHKFILSPDGNGVDTHRLWETLYLKSIPVIKHSINADFYIDLPICFVNQWEEINEDFLNNEYERIINKKWNLEKLNFDYWKNKIKNDGILH